MKRILCILLAVLLGGWTTARPALLSDLLAQGNATVPNDASIQPPQAFVDFTYLYGWQAAGAFDAGVFFPNKGLTKIASVLNIQAAAKGSFIAPLDLSGNALPTAEIDQIVADSLTIFNEPGITNYMNFSGVAMGTPTGVAAWANAWTLSIPQQVQIKYNIHGHVAIIDPTESTSGNDFINCSMTVSEVNALLAFLVANYLNPSFTKVLDLTGNAAPTGQGIVDKATLITNGWTVTTN